MGFYKSMDIASSAMTAQRIRMNILSSNLANAQTTRTDEGGPYKRKDAVFSAVPATGTFEDHLDGTFGTQVSKVKVIEIHEDQKPGRKMFDPGHPDADKEGYVSMPNIQVMTEMVNMIAATRAYEANVTAINDAKQMALKSLEIGR